MSSSTNRRNFLRNTAIIASTAVFGATKSLAQQSDSMTISARIREKCGTCAFWGGQRTVSEDRMNVHVYSFGVCNNKNSPMYLTTTSPEHGPMDVWEKWPALD